MRKNHVKSLAKFRCQFAFRRPIFRCRQTRQAELKPLILNILSSSRECFSEAEMRLSAAVREIGAVGFGSGSVLCFDALPVLVAEAEMMADLVDQHVADNAGKVLAGLAPIIEDRPRVADALVG